MTAKPNPNPNRHKNLVHGVDLRGKLRPPEPLQGHEVAAIIQACTYRARPKVLGFRNQALIVTWWRSGLRLS
jgi:hypothetical protein